MQQPIEKATGNQLIRLLDICNKLGSSEDLPALLDIAIDGIIELIDAEFAAILLLDQITGKLKVAAASELSSFVDEYETHQKTLAKLIIESKQPLILNDTKAIEDAHITLASSWPKTLKNLLGIPLVSNSKVIGVLEIANKSGRGDYSDHDLYLVQILAVQTALAAENARLFQQTDLIAKMSFLVIRPFLPVPVT